MKIAVFVYSFILILNFLAAIYYKKNRFLILISTLLVIGFMAFNTYNPDYNNYSYWYMNGNYPDSVEHGYIYIARKAAHFGLEYKYFLLLVMLICAVIYGMIIKKIKGNYHIILCLFMVYQIYFDYVQIRCTIAVMLFSLAVYWLSVNRKWLSFITMVLSVLFHKMMLIYFPILLINPKNKKWKMIVPGCVGIILMACVIIFLNGNHIPLLAIFKDSNFLAGKYEKYFTTRTRLGWIIPFSLQIVNILLIYITNSYIQTRTFEVKELNYDITRIKRFSQSVYYIVLYSSVGFPFVMINEEFTRFFRNCNMLIYMAIGIFVSILKQQNNGVRKLVPLGQSGKCIRIEEYWCVVMLNLLLWTIMYAPNHIIYDFFMYNGLFR